MIPSAPIENTQSALKSLLDNEYLHLLWYFGCCYLLISSLPIVLLVSGGEEGPPTFLLKVACFVLATSLILKVLQFVHSVARLFLHSTICIREPKGGFKKLLFRFFRNVPISGVLDVPAYDVLTYAIREKNEMLWELYKKFEEERRVRESCRSILFAVAVLLIAFAVLKDFGYINDIKISSPHVFATGTWCLFNSMKFEPAFASVIFIPDKKLALIISQKETVK